MTNFQMSPTAVAEYYCSFPSLSELGYDQDLDYDEMKGFVDFFNWLKTSNIWQKAKWIKDTNQEQVKIVFFNGMNEKREIISRWCDLSWQLPEIKSHKWRLISIKPI